MAVVKVKEEVGLHNPTFSLYRRTVSLMDERSSTPGAQISASTDPRHTYAAWPVISPEVGDLLRAYFRAP